MDFFKNKLLTIVLVLCLAFTIFVGLTANKGGNTGVMQQTITSTIAPIQKYIYLAGQRISNIFYFVSSIATTRRENLELKTDIQSLNQKLIEFERFKRENQELNSLLEFKNNHADLKLVGANVIGKVGENWFSIIIIDKGEKDGIKKGQYVIAGQGYVGQIIETSSNNSKIITILDEKANIPAKISSSGEEGLITGAAGSSKDKMCKIDFLPVDTKAKQGDLVVTSNIIADETTLTQDNLLIGTVIQVEENKSNLVKYAYVKPIVDFSKLENVMVIVK
jgi:rod shape-determining protein MreC